MSASKTLLSFVLGAATATGVGYYFVRGDALAVNKFVSQKVTEIDAKAEKIQKALREVEDLRAELEQLKAAAVTQPQLNDTRSELLSLHDQVQVSLAQHKASVYDMVQDVYRILGTNKQQ
eukprot:comp11700_c1_seq1/m.6257 comp11700_c1_seq1/g.6257  ORF comp11700_c1_seq1/g.6257 comp11700_c1_seq1/m.6257 type:complete len:120 (-) comp11700_c1_seq1:294-653(-)